jgi:hypothetical protein
MLRGAYDEGFKCLSLQTRALTMVETLSRLGPLVPPKYLSYLTSYNMKG